MSVYVPGTQEKDLSKVIMSLQAVSAEVDTNTSNVSTNTSNISTLQTKTNGYEAAWTAYTPTVTAQTGTITAYTATGRYKQIGKTVIMQADVTITTAGTGINGLRVSLPFTAANFNYAGTSREIVNTGKAGSANVIAGGTTLDARDATGATYIASGNEVVCFVTYEVP